MIVLRKLETQRSQASERNEREQLKIRMICFCFWTGASYGREITLNSLFQEVYFYRQTKHLNLESERSVGDLALFD